METLLTPFKSRSSKPLFAASGSLIQYPPPNMTWQKDLTLRSIKILDIGYVTTIYFLVAFFLSIWIDNKILGEFQPEEQKEKPTSRLIGECILHIYLIGVLVYFMRNIVEKIPFPLDGVQGFIHLKVKEVTNASVFVFIFVLYQKNLRARLDYIHNRLYKKDILLITPSPKL